LRGGRLRRDDNKSPSRPSNIGPKDDVPSLGEVPDYEPSSPEQSLDNPESLAGASSEDVENLIPEGFKKESTTGKVPGTKYTQVDGKGNPVRGGMQVRIMKGDPKNPNPVKRGPYARVSNDFKKSEHIPLKGNPTLEQ